LVDSRSGTAATPESGYSPAASSPQCRRFSAEPLLIPEAPRYKQVSNNGVKGYTPNILINIINALYASVLYGSEASVRRRFTRRRPRTAPRSTTASSVLLSYSVNPAGTKSARGWRRSTGATLHLPDCMTARSLRSGRYAARIELSPSDRSPSGGRRDRASDRDRR
jgi:hypothetical protein